MHLRLFPLLRVLVASAAALCCVGVSSALAQESSPQQRRIQAIADKLRTRLGITDPVQVSIVEANHLLLSVEPIAQSSPRTFALRVEDGFAATLDDDELAAAIAHELGHVWIFTHHPFLQTEQLANEIAMRLVSRDSLAELYDKVWRRAGTKGDIARFLGPAAPSRGLASPETNPGHTP
jgi:hypothetical protein